MIQEREGDVRDKAREEVDSNCRGLALKFGSSSSLSDLQSDTLKEDFSEVQKELRRQTGSYASIT